MMRTQLQCTFGGTCYPKRGDDPGRSYRLRVTQLTRHCCSTLLTQFGVVVAVQRSDRGSSPRTGLACPGRVRALQRTQCSKSVLLRESRRVERTHLLRLKLSTRHHVANRGRVPLPAARRIDPARVQGLGDLPQ